MQACHLTCQLGTLAEVSPLEFDNVKYVRGHNQYCITLYQLNQGRECMHTSCKALTSVYASAMELVDLWSHFGKWGHSRGQ